MDKQYNRRDFISRSASAGLGFALMPQTLFGISQPLNDYSFLFPFLKRGEKQLFADDIMIALTSGVKRSVNQAKKLEHPVLEADMPWEQGDDYEGPKDRRVYIYGTVIKDGETGKFRMWYNRLRNSYYAISDDGVHWQRPDLENPHRSNRVELFRVHSPSIIFDKFETDPSKSYKPVGSIKGGFDADELLILKNRFKNLEWYSGKSAYCAAYSADGINWNRYPHPILLASDTITLVQDPLIGEYLAFHKILGDPKVTGRQVSLSVSKDMQNWSEPKMVMVTDETDHKAARLLEAGTHSEFYNLSAFPFGSQWLGLVSRFRRTVEPRIKGPDQSSNDGPLDLQLVHSRDGRKWEHCSDRSPDIDLGPYLYNSGIFLGVCNSPVITGDEMWMYYTAITTTHGGYLPVKVLCIARAAWRLDGIVSMYAGYKSGFVETSPKQAEGRKLFVNADVKKRRTKCGSNR